MNKLLKILLLILMFLLLIVIFLIFPEPFIKYTVPAVFSSFGVASTVLLLMFVHFFIRRNFSLN